MDEIPIEQAIYGSQDAGGYRFLARSPGFLDDWLPEAERLCTGFGERPAGVACPACVFAQPFGKRQVAIVQAADQGTDDAGRPGALAFHLLVMPRAAYVGFGGDPFLLAQRCTPSWQVRGQLPTLFWPAEPLPRRTVAQVQSVLQRYSEVCNLLGPAQVLVDGGRLVYERQAPATDLLSSLWTLLPTSTRCELWPASFAFGNSLRFHALVTPRVAGEELEAYVMEEQAADYPAGRYELNLQLAAEAGNQRELNALFARRSRSETLRLAFYILIAAIIGSAVLGWLNRPSPPSASGRHGPADAPKLASGRRQPAGAAPSLNLLPADHYPKLSEREREQLTWELSKIAAQLEVPLPDQLRVRLECLAVAGWTPQTDLSGCLSAAALLHSDRQVMPYFLMKAEPLVEAIDQRLGTPDPQRDPAALNTLGPIQRRLRALLWKHGVADYDKPGLNPLELIDRLQQVIERKLDRKEARD